MTAQDEERDEQPASSLDVASIETERKGPSLALRFANPFMKWLLRSRWHGAASGQLMLITVTGRRSGKQYTLPVNYVEYEDVEYEDVEYEDVEYEDVEYEDVEYEESEEAKLESADVEDIVHDADLSIISHTHRTWWRNLRGGAPVTVCLRGKTIAAQARVVEAIDQVADGLIEHLSAVPVYAEALGVRLDEEGTPRAEDSLQAAEGKVLVYIALSDSDPAQIAQ